MLLRQLAGLPRCATAIRNATPILLARRAASSTSNAAANLEATATAMNVRLTAEEMATLHDELDVDRDGVLQNSELEASWRKTLDERLCRDVLLRAIERPKSKLDQLGSRLIDALDYMGTALFACVGVQIAGGEADMNIVGCTLIGCVAAMGGGTINNVLYGAAREGAFWVRTPSFLMVALASSLATFFLWPKYCETCAVKAIAAEVTASNGAAAGDHRLNQCTFAAYLAAHPDFHARACSVFGVAPEGTSADALFALIDNNGSGSIEVHELCNVIRLEVDSTRVMYLVDSLALSALSVVAANGAIARGLHPLVACTSGVTICFGGLLRDLMCGRDLAIGGQSYAMATGVGASLYVGLRELAVRGLPLPLIARTLLSVGAVLCLRAYDWMTPGKLLPTMHAFGAPPKKG